MEIVAGRFEELPQEILMDIFALLKFSDLLRVGSVCFSWNLAYSSLCSFGQLKCSHTPCLIYTSESAGENVAFLYSLMEKRACKLNSSGASHPKKVSDWIVTRVVDYCG
jgi:hypothetical protein